MVNETEKVGKRNIVHTIKTPTDIKELQEQLNKLAAKGNTFIMIEPQKKSFFAKVKTFLKKKKKWEIILT